MRSEPRFFELLTTQQMSRADQLTIAAGVPGSFLMEQAGGAVARQALALVAEPRHVLILCGPGNNGGDGFVAARLLAAGGAGVELCLFGSLDELKGDAASAAQAYRGGLTAFGDLDFDAADIAIDAIFGAGLARDLAGDVKAAVDRLNQWAAATGRPVLAVDVPTGIDGNTGAIRGAAVNAAQTITFFRRKPGHLLLPGRLHCGETIVAGIGIPSNVLDEIKPRAFANHPGLWGKRFPVPHAAGHKYTRGHAVVLSGGLAHTGAPRLAARGALRAGAGLVTLAVPVEALAIQAMAVTAIMTTRCDSAADLLVILKDRRKNALVLGPGLGLGEAACALTEAVLREESKARAAGELARSFVLDADVLTSFAGKAHELAKSIHASGSAVVMTPHEGEFARLFGSIEESHAREWAGLHDAALFQSLVQGLKNASKLERARCAAKLSGAVIVLKGADTIVAGPDGHATIAGDLPPWLATAGSGDVLAGIIGGLLAQAMPVFEAASAAVWLHGAAARHFGIGLIAEDIPENLPKALNELREKNFLSG